MSTDRDVKLSNLSLVEAAKKAASAMAAISPQHIPSTKDWEALRDAQRLLMSAIESVNATIAEVKAMVERETKREAVLNRAQNGPRPGGL